MTGKKKKAGRIMASVAREWSGAEQTVQLLPRVANRLLSEDEQKSDCFRARPGERIKEAVERD